MAFPTPVNGQITDAVPPPAPGPTPGPDPATVIGTLFAATSQALSNAAHNATNAQQQAYVTMQAATTMGVATLYSTDTAAAGTATKEVLP